MGPICGAHRNRMTAAFGDSAELLGQYGLKPRKPTVASPATRVAAAAKAKATRAARHTMGSKQRVKHYAYEDQSARFELWSDANGRLVRLIHADSHLLVERVEPPAAATTRKPPAKKAGAATAH